LVLRPFAPADATAAFTWFGDADVMRFIGGGVDRTLNDTSNRLSRYINHQERCGFSKWLVQEKASGRAIGDSGLLILDELGPTADLGFRFAKSHWGCGLATEVALVLRRGVMDMPLSAQVPRM
jgi:RimJ/RimL family protein N-acetyltransferase